MGRINQNSRKNVKKTIRPTNKGVKTARKVESVTVRDALLTALADNEKLVVLASRLATHALPHPFNQLAELTREVATTYPARFFGLGELLEELVPTAHRLINEGLRPLVLIGSTDLARSYAGLSALCAAGSPVIFILAAEPLDGQTLYPVGLNDLAILRTLPPLKIGVPSSQVELKRQLIAALATEDSGPLVIHYGATIPAEAAGRARLTPPVGIGKAQMLHEGKDLAILALGAGVGSALALAEKLKEQGYEAAIVDANWLRPLDEPLLLAVANYFLNIVTLETGNLAGGFGAAVLEILETNHLYNLRVKRISLDNYLQLEPEIRLARMTGDVRRFVEKLLQDEGMIGPGVLRLLPGEA